MKTLLFLMCIFLLSQDAHAKCSDGIHYFLKLEAYDATISIYDTKNTKIGIIGCLKSNNKEFEFNNFGSLYPMDAGFFGERRNYFYVVGMSADGTFVYQVFESLNGKMLANIISGKNLPSVIWLPDAVLPIICVNNKNINNHYDYERRDSDGIYRYDRKIKKYIKYSRRTKYCQ